MPEDIAKWLDIALRIKTEWGMPLFVAVSYTLTTLFAISQVRAIRMSRRDANKLKPLAEQREYGRIQIRMLAFAVGFPLEALVAHLWGLTARECLLHGVMAGVLTPVVADIWIQILRWRKLNVQVEMFKVSSTRRFNDTIAQENERRRRATSEKGAEIDAALREKQRRVSEEGDLSRDGTTRL